MPTELLDAYNVLRDFLGQPPVYASIFAMGMAFFRILGDTGFRPSRKWAEIGVVGIAAYAVVPIAEAKGYGEAFSAGIGAGIGYFGMTIFEARLDKWLGVRKKSDGNGKNEKQ